MVAISIKITQSQFLQDLSDSASIHFYNSTFIKTQHFGESCYNSGQHISLEGPHYKIKDGPMSNSSGTFYKTTCADCLVLSAKVESPNFKSEELCLYSKRRKVDPEEMREFAAWCLKMHRYLVMDHTKELCPVPPEHISSSWGVNRESKGLGDIASWHLLIMWIKWMSIHKVLYDCFCACGKLSATTWMNMRFTNEDLRKHFCCAWLSTQ